MQPIEFNNLNHEEAFRNIIAFLVLAVTIILGSVNVYFYIHNQGWFLFSLGPMQKFEMFFIVLRL